jgi:hypothetical protein
MIADSQLSLNAACPLVFAKCPIEQMIEQMGADRSSEIEG